MTKLEEDIRATIKNLTLDDSSLGKLNKIVIAQAAAEVAKRYIEDAWDEGEQYGEIKSEHANYDDLVRNKSEWLKDNGITE